jgi:hypothetical protein
MYFADAICKGEAARGGEGRGTFVNLHPKWDW